MLLLLILATAVSCEDKEQEAPDGATKLNVTFAQSTVSAAHNSIEGTVACNADWSVSLDKTSWAVVEKKGKSSFTVSFDPNNTDAQRTGTIVINSGKLKKSVQFTQSSRSAFFSPATISLSGTQPGTSAFDAPAAWTASVTSGDDWLTLSTASGNAGRSTLSCAAKSENTGDAPRNGSIRLRINGGVLDIAVVQAVKGQGPDPYTGPAPGIYGINGSNYVLGENGWNQSSRVVLADGSLQYILMNRAAVEITAVLEYDATAAVGSTQNVVVYRQGQSGALLYQPYQVQVTESTDSYIKLANSATTYFIIQK